MKNSTKFVKLFPTRILTNEENKEPRNFLRLYEKTLNECYDHSVLRVQNMKTKRLQEEIREAKNLMLEHKEQEGKDYYWWEEYENAYMRFLVANRELKNRREGN